MKIVFIIILLFVVCFIHKYLVKIYRNLKEDFELKKISLKINCTNREFANNYFKLNKIGSVSKKANYKGIYNPLLDKVKLPNLDNKVSFDSINTILHEYKHKNDRLVLITAELLSYIVIINIFLLLIHVGFYVPFYLIVTFCIYNSFIKTIAEYRALKFSYSEMDNFTGTMDRNRIKRLVTHKTINDGYTFFMAYGSFIFISYFCI